MTNICSINIPAVGGKGAVQFVHLCDLTGREVEWVRVDTNGTRGYSLTDKPAPSIPLRCHTDEDFHEDIIDFVGRICERIAITIAAEAHPSMTTLVDQFKEAAQFRFVDVTALSPKPCVACDLRKRIRNNKPLTSKVQETQLANVAHLLNVDIAALPCSVCGRKEIV